MTRRLPWARNLPASTASGGGGGAAQSSPGTARAGPSTPASAREASREVKAQPNSGGSGGEVDENDDEGETEAGDGAEHELVPTPRNQTGAPRNRGRAVTTGVGAGRAADAGECIIPGFSMGKAIYLCGKSTLR